MKTNPRCTRRFSIFIANAQVRDLEGYGPGAPIDCVEPVAFYKLSF